MLAYMYIENSVVLSVIVPLLMNVPAVVPLPKYNPRLPLIVPVPPLFNVKLPSSVPPLELKALVLIPATPSRVPPVNATLEVLIAVLKFAVPPEIVTDEGLIVPVVGVKFAVPPVITMPEFNV